MRIQEIAIQLDFKTDESYTPSKISIRAGTNLQDLTVQNIIEEILQIQFIIKEAVYVELNEPTGWYIFPLKTKLLDETEKPYILTMNIQIAILQNQHSGKDTHVRQILIFGPREKQNQGLGFPNFKSPDITQYYTIR
ncbi:hypothetical protein IMG5_159070 [Ichthyophthirius multifiliis]|uniref:DOC domain-containing protein n=1 Tax=Ichthyophthirius multifiliis TaxID=5932 RepID=G0QZQ4_ICHMU|nr:hypothetical protein IMG5_159070 [Ichthyophthirius multifiliis]EGR29293.1 hypothetical protein IMG5_159070 [Ichthyophthirius multifiliis]|eukprot:XP_004030529.1 hypothetical protein IMG5_159070 [Ichthyophthirius multifiliis]